MDVPYWVMVPHVSILDSYLRHERRDYRNRSSAAARGVTVRRTLPVIDKVNALYYTFIMDSDWASTTALVTDTKGWAGEPTTVILKCVAGLGLPSEQITATNVAGTIIRVGPLEEVRGKVQELIRLWSRPPPRVDGMEEGGIDKAGRAAGGGSGADKSQEGKGRKRTRGDHLGSLAPKRVLRPRGGDGKTTMVLKWLNTIP